MNDSDTKSEKNSITLKVDDLDLDHAKSLSKLLGLESGTLLLSDEVYVTIKDGVALCTFTAFKSMPLSRFLGFLKR